MRFAAAMSSLVLWTTAIACASPSSTRSPYCASPTPLPETTHDCRASTVFYQQKLVDAIDSRLRSQHFGSLRISAEFDPVTSLPSACIEGGAETVAWVVRQQLATCNEALRRLEPGPACLSGTRLDVTDALSAAAESSGLRRPPEPEKSPDFDVPTAH